MSLRRCHHGSGLWVLPHHLLEHWVVQEVHVHLDVCLMVLVDERFDRLHVEHVHVLRDRIDWFDIVLDREDLLNVTQPQHLKHLPVELG